MKIRYKKKQVKLILIMGIVSLIYGIIHVIFNEDMNSFDYVWFVFSGISLIMYFYEKKEKYLTLENGIIKQNWPFGKKMNLNEIKRIRHFAGDYILESKNKELTINIQSIDEEAMLELKTELKKLNAEWSKKNDLPKPE
ncbi:hypothetical protein [Cognatitamlana onchidii]|uniref:hypothetical protein n=1 Tax=Cognatitamlana onchidii TaxID=2562860 RepID=UPI0010A6457F|nr:hypothetical protein [Algibacter onchidii]